MIKKTYLKSVLISVSVLALCTLVGYNLRDIIFGSTFSVQNIKNGETISDTYLPIKGFAPRAKEVSINGHMVPLERTGAFSDGILLSKGYNVVEVSLVDRFGREQTKTYQLAQVGSTDTVATNINLNNLNN